MFRAFPKKPYRQRAKIESIFSGRQTQTLLARTGRSLATQVRQALLLGLAYNIYRLRHRFAQGGCQQSLSVDSKRVRMHKDCAFLTRFRPELTPRNFNSGEVPVPKKRKSADPLP